MSCQGWWRTMLTDARLIERVRTIEAAQKANNRNENGTTIRKLGELSDRTPADASSAERLATSAGAIPAKGWSSEEQHKAPAA